MHTQPNARLTPLGRERLVHRHIDEHVPLAELPFQAGISLRTTYKWLARFRSGGPVALVDRRNIRRTQRRTFHRSIATSAATAMCHERCIMRRNAKALAAPLSTVGRLIKVLGLGSAQKPAAQGSFSALPIAASRRHVPREHQTVGAL